MSLPTVFQYPHVERAVWTKQITAGGTPTQISILPWTTPANACGWLEKLAFSNQNAAAAVVTIWDADITSTGTKPPARGSNAAPLLPPINLAANSQLWIGTDLCPNIELIGGIVAQSTQTTVYVTVQYLVQLG